MHREYPFKYFLFGFRQLSLQDPRQQTLSKNRNYVYFSVVDAQPMLERFNTIPVSKGDTVNLTAAN